LGSPYYATWLTDHGLNADAAYLEDFPVLTKESLLENFDVLITDPEVSLRKVDAFVQTLGSERRLFLDRYYVTRTSGTSGQQSYFLYRPEEVVHGISHAYRSGTRLAWRKRMAFVGFTRALAASTLTLGFSQRFLLSRLMFDYRCIDIELPFDQVVAELADEIPILTTVQGGRQTVHPICFDRLMPDEVKTFQIVSEQENDFEFRVLLKGAENANGNAICAEVERRVSEFFVGRGLSQVVFRVTIVTGLLVNEKSGKTTFWRQAPWTCSTSGERASTR